MVASVEAKLLAHAQRVCQAVLTTDESARVSASVYIAREADLTAHILVTHEYMIIIDFSGNAELMQKAQGRFATFLGKEARVHEVGTTCRLFWGEGEVLDSTPTDGSQLNVKGSFEMNDILSTEDAIEWLKTNTVLPSWLDCLLFESLGAQYEPDWKKFEHNLDHDRSDIQAYIGTYFPRSYAEAFCIFDDLFSYNQYKMQFRNLTEVWILDIGCGTGGNLIGLLTALAKHWSQLDTVHVHGFDGNTQALGFATTILESFAHQVQFHVDFKLTNTHVKSIKDLPIPENNLYDFITSFKMGGEIVSKGKGENDEIYYHILNKYIDRLSNIGLLILLDVSIKPDHTNYLPILLNEQLSRFLRDNQEFSTIVPIPCHLYETDCVLSCFTQKEFCVSHRGALNDLSRVAYRILARKPCASTFHVRTDENAGYIVRKREANEAFSICENSNNRGEQLDGFKIFA
jgi:hypothetical protein